MEEEPDYTKLADELCALYFDQRHKIEEIRKAFAAHLLTAYRDGFTAGSKKGK